MDSVAEPVSQTVPLNSQIGQAISTLKPNVKAGLPIDGFVKDPLKSASGGLAPIKSSQFHKRTERAQTLMRGAVKKPAQQFHSNLKKLSPNSNIERELRAKLTPKHGRVDHFGHPIARPKPAIQSHVQPLSGELINRGSNKHHGTSPVTTAAPLPSMITSASHQKLERLLDEALAKADTHKQAMHYQAARHFWHKRWLSGRRRWLAAAILLAIAVVGLSLAWQRIPQLSVKLAGLRAHIVPSLPTYKPDGYDIAGPAAAVSGVVQLKYQSVQDAAKSYEINQTSSNLTSASLAQNVVPKGVTVQTSQVQGNIVYIYDTNNDAAWVNNGILYTIKDQARLNSDQLINIVKGINP